MNEAIEFLHHHGYGVLVAFVALEQMGFPVPAAPVMLAMGALIGQDLFSFPVALAAVAAASLPGDWIWYELGRLRGYGVLRVICRIAIEADVCVKRTENVFVKYGDWALVFAKFLPGFSTVAPPLAGMLKMPRWRFFALDSAGAAIWGLIYIGAGYVFRNQLETLAAWLEGLGSGALIIIGVAIGAWLGYKWFERRRFIRLLSTARITVDDLRERLDRGDEITIIDLRHDFEFEREGGTIPGALHIKAEEIRRRIAEIPRGPDIVLYCT